MAELRAAKEQGRSVLLSSHILSEVEKACDTVTIIRAGRSVESGTLAELRHLTRSAVSAVVAGDAAAVAALPGVHDVVTTPTEGGTRVQLDVDAAHVGGLLAALARLGVGSFTAAPPSLEELFLRHYGDELPAGDAPAGGDGQRRRTTAGAR
jgi:ABC-2 type transport system ATP-binding protein